MLIKKSLIMPIARKMLRPIIIPKIYLSNTLGLATPKSAQNLVIIMPGMILDYVKVIT